jgi:SEL1 protein
MSEWISNFLRDDHLYYGDNGYDDNYLPETDPMPGDVDGLYEDIIDDGILESIIILGLAAVLVVLIYYRQQHQLAHRRGEEVARRQQVDQAAQDGQRQQPPQEDRGVFPQPGDPEFGQWVAGGVGH